MSTYQSIAMPPTIDNSWNDSAVEEQVSQVSNHRRIAILGMALLGFVGVMVGVGAGAKGSNAGMTSEEEGLLLGSASVRDCTFSECFASNCNHEVAPFTCLFHNGGPHGGCSPTPWIEGTCSEQCNLEPCDSLEIPDSEKSCKGVQCDPAWCKGGQVCGPDVPYQCTDGSARFGCSSEIYQWKFMTSPQVCSSCCDTTTC